MFIRDITDTDPNAHTNTDTNAYTNPDPTASPGAPCRGLHR